MARTVLAPTGHQTSGLVARHFDVEGPGVRTLPSGSPDRTLCRTLFGALAQEPDTVAEKVHDGRTSK